MIRRTLLLALAAAAAVGCGSSTTQVGNAIRRPVSLAFFDGLTTKWPGRVYRYMAVAAFAGNELQIIDPADDRAVIGPGLVFPLSVPTAPGPVMLAAADPGDRDLDTLGLATVHRPGLLAVASLQAPSSAASTSLPTLKIEIVATWNTLTSLAPALAVDLVGELEGVDPTIVDAQLLALIAMPVPGQVGRASLVAALSGGRLAVVTYERDPASTAHALRRVPGTPVRLVPAVTTIGGSSVPFDALDLVLAPDGVRIFAATRQALGDGSGAQVHGVAQFATAFAADGGPTATWPAVGIDATAPTRLVAAARVAERMPPGTMDAPKLGAVDYFQTTRELQVFAVVDEASCGSRTAIDCGIVTLRPDASPPGLAADPAGELPFRAPIRIPGRILSMVAAMPRRGGDTPLFGDNAKVEGGVMRLGPPSGQFDGTALLAVASASGAVYLVDLGRYALGNAGSVMRGGGRAAIIAASAYAPILPAKDTDKNWPGLGVWDDYTHADAPDGPPHTAPTCVPPVDSTAWTIYTRKVLLAPSATDAKVYPSANARTCPGYAKDDTYTVAWKGTLPGLSLRDGILAQSGGNSWVAMQIRGPPDGSGARPWKALLDVTDPVLGVRIGDTVTVDVPDTTLCPQETLADGSVVQAQVRAPVIGFVAPTVPPDADHPGGALLIGPWTDPDTTYHCADAITAELARQRQAGTATPKIDAYLGVRVPGLVISGAIFGYAGRPVLSTADNTCNAQQAQIDADTFRLKWEPEGPLLAAAQGGDRLAAEKLAIVRKLRRVFYPIDDICPAASDTFACPDWPATWDPLNPPAKDRVALTARFGLLCRAPPSGVHVTTCQPEPEEDKTFFIIATQPGLSPWSMRPPTGGAFPVSVGTFDGSIYSSDDTTHVVSTFTDNQVVNFLPLTSSVAVMH